MTSPRTQFTSTRNRSRVQKNASWGRNQNTVAFMPSAKLGPVAHTVIVALMIALLGLLYLTQLTKTSSYGYEMNSIDDKKTELVAERDDLKVENARLQALSRVKDSNVAANMTAPSSVDYATN